MQIAHILPVVAATLVVAGLSVIWYSSSLFGGTWSRIMGRTGDDAMPFLIGRITAGLLMLFGAFFALSLIFSHFELIHADALRASSLIATIALLPVASAVVWEERPREYVLIHGTFLFLAILIGGGIIAYWPW